jgi:thiosulfate/3-mercaptopyruvate sulfurtransferase
MLPLVLDIEQLQTLLAQNSPDLQLIDLCKAERFSKAHIPGAILVTPGETQCSENYPGLAPEATKLTALVEKIGLNPALHLIVYDDEGGGWAGRFIWLLDEIGHRNYSYLNGGFTAWQAAGYETESGPTNTRSIAAGDYATSGEYTITKDTLLDELGSSPLCVWDARSAAEYAGEKSPSKRMGHIPGAVNFDWLDTMDRKNHLKLRDLGALRAELAKLGITGDKAIVAHCQSHHRSGLAYLIAKILGFENIRAYAGSWGEWGNDVETPIELS